MVRIHSPTMDSNIFCYAWKKRNWSNGHSWQMKSTDTSIGSWKDRITEHWLKQPIYTWSGRITTSVHHWNKLQLLSEFAGPFSPPLMMRLDSYSSLLCLSHRCVELSVMMWWCHALFINTNEIQSDDSWSHDVSGCTVMFQLYHWFCPVRWKSSRNVGSLTLPYDGQVTPFSLPYWCNVFEAELINMQRVFT